MHGRFGKNLVAQMLCGSKNKKLQQWKLHRLSTYGLLSALRQTEVVAVMDSLIEAGLLQQKEVDERRPTIHMTEGGRRVMLAQDPLPAALRMPFPLAKRLAAATRHIESGDVQTRSAGDDHSQEVVPDEQAAPQVTELAERLKRWRRKTSAALGIPAYRVLTNATIDRIAQSCPTSTGQLEAISGVGPATVEQFGYDIVELIRETIRGSGAEPTQDIEETLAERLEDEQPEDCPDDDPTIALTNDARSELPTTSTTAKREDAYWTWRLFRDGYSADQIAAIRRCDSSSLVDDLIVAAQSGHPVDPNWITTPEGEKRFRDAVIEAPISR
jgi:ATP-dependent DNA helicase RecQ